ncbi:hypothetical protein KR054_009513 [Drosophila jambulina]|nr:hypothetical protein KR054_009513 [Drosophila jambulina]
MDKINEDLWLKILQFLPMIDQISLAQVNEDIREYVKYHWRHSKSITLTGDVLEFFGANEPLMLEGLECWSGSVQRLKISRGSMELLKKWTPYSFPQLRTLDCEMDYNLEEADDETLLLTNLFPLLTHLTLSSSTTGCHLWRWKLLKELHLIWCEYLDTDTFKEIFSTLQLKKLTLLYYGYNVTLGEDVLEAARCSTLEELQIDDHHLLGDFLPQLLRLPHFRRLSFYTRDYYEYLLGTVAKSQPLKVRSLLFHDAFWSSERVTDAIEAMKNLRRLVLQDDDIKSHLLYTICHKLPHLEELHLLKMRDLPWPSQLWEDVGACPTLRILNLSSTKLSYQMVKPSATRLSKILLHRRAPLTLHLHNTGLDPQKVHPDLEHPNLRISFEPIKLNIWSSRFVEIEFNPDSDKQTAFSSV